MVVESVTVDLQQVQLEDKTVPNTSRRDHLIEIERRVIKEWEDAKMFEAEPDLSKPKYMVTFPYPYMNGFLHVGHLFTITKVEFASRYHRLKGENVLFPFGLHCTGMPIQAAANKLKNETLKTHHSFVSRQMVFRNWTLLIHHSIEFRQMETQPNLADLVEWRHRYNLN